MTATQHCTTTAPLVWSPVFTVLEDRIKAGDDIILILVPFAKLAALQQLHWVHTNKVKFKLICRWRPEDLLSGASDLEVFSYLKDSGCQLYINPAIHLKLYVFSSNTAFNTSGNLTLSGLGYTEHGNIEVGNTVDLVAKDWAQIYHIINSSRQVDDHLYTKYKAFLQAHPPQGLPAAPPDLLPPLKTYTIATLPASESPERLAAFYFAAAPANFTPEEVRRAMHDLVTFAVPPGLTKSGFEAHIAKAFRATPFVRDFVALLQEARSLRFGAVNNWIHQKCEDVPLPYRWEIKENTHVFYDWLAHYIPGITWDRPNHSQVIYWRKTAT